MCKPCSYFTTINIQTTLCDIFYFCFYLWIPFCEIMNSTTNFIKWHITFLPLWHLEYFQVSKNLSNFFVIIFNIIMRDTKILVDLFIHLSTNTIELNRLWNDRSNISKFLGFFLRYRTTLNLSRNSMYTFYNVDHILKCIFNIILQIFLTRVECHMLLFDSNIKQPSLSLLFHFVQQ